jgi:hypothetical protein
LREARGIASQQSEERDALGDRQAAVEIEQLTSQRNAGGLESESPTHVGMWRKCRGALRQHCLKVEEGIPSRDQNQRPAKIGRQLALTIDNAKRDGVEVSERADGS